MLDPRYLLTVGDSLANQFFELETEILIDIAKRLKANDLNMVSTAQYQIMKLQQLGLQTDYINQMLAQLLGVSDEQVAKIMSDSAYESIREDMKIYQEADMLDGRTVDLTEQVKAGTNALKGELSNLCQTTVQTANKRYMDLLDKAYLSVSSGLLSSQQAVDQAVKELAKDGLQMVDYKSGAHRQLDSAVRVAVRTATTKNACACQEQVMDDLDVNLVEVSSHMGARPSHAKWQGNIYWRKKKYGNYKNFEDTTRYGHGDGLGGWNCRHQFYPYIPGVSEKTYEPYRLTENKEQYELEQKQRYNERNIREWKRRQQIMEAAGLDSTYERSKVREWQKKNKALIDAHADMLKRDYSREKAYLSSTEKKPTMTISGKTAPKDKQEWLRKKYEEAKKEGYISALVTFKTYNQTAYKITKNIVNTSTKDGIMITGFTPHMIDRIIGNYKASNEKINDDSFAVKFGIVGTRKGVKFKYVVDCLKNGKSSGVKIDKKGKKSITYRTDKCQVSINPDTGELLQTTPRE